VCVVQVTPEGVIYIGHSDTTVKMYQPRFQRTLDSLLHPVSPASLRDASPPAAAIASGAAATNGATASVAATPPTSNGAALRNSSGGGAAHAPAVAIAAALVDAASLDAGPAYMAEPVRAPDATTNATDGHVGPVNALVVAGNYVCSAGKLGCNTVRECLSAAACWGVTFSVPG
jgi:hypothetical protein